MISKGFLINDKIEYEIIDARKLKIISHNLRIDDNNLICGNTIIDLNNDIPVQICGQSHLYKISSYKQLSNNVLEIETSKRTKSSFMMMPVISENRSSSAIFGWGLYFVNAYIGYDEYPSNGDRLFVVCRTVNSDSYRKFESLMTSRPNFVEILDLDWYHSCFVFSFNYKQEIVDNFLLGKYSLFPDGYKRRILSFHGLDNQSELADILYKRESRRLFLSEQYEHEVPQGNELYSSPDLDLEILKSINYDR